MSAMSDSLMDESNTNKAVPNKTKFGGKKLMAAVGVGVLATGILTGCVVSSMRKNPAIFSLQSPYSGSAYTGTATLDNTNQAAMGQQGEYQSQAGVQSNRCNTNPYGQCPPASGPPIDPPTTIIPGKYWPWNAAYATIGFNLVAGNPVSIDYGEDNTSWANQIFECVYP